METKSLLKKCFVIIILLLGIIGMTNLNAQEFTVCDLNYRINDDGVSVTVTGHVDGNGATGELIIPESVSYNNNDYPVTKIGDYAFAECSSITGVLTIPNSITLIGNWAFALCSGFTGSLMIPNSVLILGHGVFFGCSGFTGTLIIPSSIEILMQNPFSGCYGLDEIIVDTENFTYDSRNSCNAIIESCNNVLISGCKNTIIPNDVITIDYNAFYNCKGLESIIIPHDVTSIRGRAFYDCSDIKEIQSLCSVAPELGELVFTNIGCNEMIVPCGCIPIYQNSDWSQYFTTIIEDCSDVGEFNENMASVYPNPTSNIVKIEAENIQNISIYNMLGEMVFDSEANGNEFEYDFSNNESGVYIVRVETAQGVVTKRVTVM